MNRLAKIFEAVLTMSCFCFVSFRFVLFYRLIIGWVILISRSSTLLLTTMDDLLESYRKAVINAFNFQYANLSSALQGCMTKFTEEAFAASMISESVMRKGNFADIANDFKTGLRLRKTVEEVQTHCRCLIRILEGLDGPAAIVGRNLGTELSTLSSQYGMPP